MPRNVLEFRVVIASPSDVYETRRAAFEGLHELNRIFEAQNISIRALGWEEYASPGIGLSAQDVISAQILREYDVLLAIFGTKLGTPTPNAPSGTVEEIEHAIAKQSLLGRHRVQVYFLDKIESVSSISIDEFKRVSDFRESLGKRGVLYRLFKDDNELQREVRVNVQRSILEHLQAIPHWTSSESRPSDSLSNIVTEETAHALTEQADGEFGLLDLQERGEEAMGAAGVAINRMNELIIEIGAATDHQTSEMEKLTLSNSTAKDLKHSVNEFASFIEQKSANLKQEASNARESFSAFAQAVVALAILQRQGEDQEQYQKNVAALLATVEPILGTLPENRKSLEDFKTAIQNIPRITSQFNRAKKQLVDAIDECILMHDQTEREIYEITNQV